MKHQTIKAARRRVLRLRLFHGTWYPTTYEQPTGDNPRGAFGVLPVNNREDIMHAYKIQTRTLPPIESKGKRVHVDSAAGLSTTHPWDHAYDAPEVHENAARKVAEAENPGEKITVQRIGTNAMGYTFRVIIGEVDG